MRNQNIINAEKLAKVREDQAKVDSILDGIFHGGQEEKIAQYAPGDKITLKNAQMYPQNGRVEIDGYDESGRSEN